MAGGDPEVALLLVLVHRVVAPGGVGEEREVLVVLRVLHRVPPDGALGTSHVTGQLTQQVGI